MHESSHAKYVPYSPRKDMSCNKDPPVQYDSGYA